VNVFESLVPSHPGFLDKGPVNGGCCTHMISYDQLPIMDMGLIYNGSVHFLD